MMLYLRGKREDLLKLRVLFRFLVRSRGIACNRYQKEVVLEVFGDIRRYVYICWSG